MSTPGNELERAGLAAARDARAEVAAVMHAVGDDHPELAAQLSTIVATLYSAEVGEGSKIHSCLVTADDTLKRLLEQDRWVTRERIARGLSRALAQIHPARVALGRGAAGAARPDEPTQPFLLTSHNVKASLPPEEAERRTTSRSELEVEVGLEGDNRFFTGRTDDISEGGLFVATDAPLPVGRKLILSFVLPDGYRVAAEATVTWVRAPRYRPDELPSGMGVRFDRLPEEDRRALEHHLVQRPAFRYGD